MRLAITMMIVVVLGIPRIVLSQISDERAPGNPLNYKAMKDFNTNLPKQIRYFQRLPGISTDYRLGQGDRIAIEVVGSEELNQTLKISNTGTFTFPLLGEIKAAGLTAEELELQISRSLMDRQLIKEPEVLVYIESYEAKPIYVVGEVDNPGEYVMSQQLTIMDALFVAGGLDYTAARYGYLHRRLAQGAKPLQPQVKQQVGQKPIFNVLAENILVPDDIIKNPSMAAPGMEVISIDLQPFKEGGVLEPNILLKSGDVFVVPRRNIELFYVVGDVVSPGAQEIPQGVSLLASQAISWAGGPAKTAKMSDGMLVRHDDKGERQELKVDYAAILEGRQQDFQVRPNDIIFIPGSNAKTLAYGLLGIIPTTVSGSITRKK